MVIFGQGEKVGGEIKYFGLEDWWFSTFTKEERQTVQKLFQPMGGAGCPLTDGKVTGTSATASQSLHVLASWPDLAQNRSLIMRFLDKAEELAVRDGPATDLHFTLMHKMTLHYKDRDNHEDALNCAISCCIRMIEIAPKVAAEMKREYPTRPLPTHPGFQQLTIIYDKQGRIQEAIDLCEEAMRQEWNGDWDKRIARYKKKLGKQSASTGKRDTWKTGKT